ncbi:MAG TPA: multidrug efflux RND transporter permease subunit [Gemmataceae bacterium]|jgi:HAE1 family hydrophobic/amphiphilic exporter-1
MISRFFIDRPILANVIAFVTVIFGAVALWRLPVEQYPQITPPTVQVSTTYPGANARVVSDTVAAPIEQVVNGVENMLYMSSTSSVDGSYALTITFDIGTDLDIAQVQVQNRVATAQPLLPEEVQRLGVTIRKQSTQIILAATLTSPHQTYDSLFMANYATLRIVDDLSRVPGVGDVRVIGSGAYAMRVWIDPDKLTARNLTTQDVVAALAEQNVQVAAGQVGEPPAPPGQPLQLTVTTLGRLEDPRQFENVVVKTGPQGRGVVYLKDVARVELGGQTYDTFASQTGREVANILVYQLPGANALAVSAAVRAELERLKQKFPPDLDYAVPFDTTIFVSAAVHDVYRTLIEAGALVLLVILVFLQDWRAVLVPATTVPVTIVGAFAFMYLLGFTVNLLTLFGLILAIGIVVDDAIVIVENAAHHIDRGESPREGTIKAMNEVTGPVIAITFVLMAVFVPASFLGGITGQLYRQFALTIAATALISAVNALTLKPAQSARWLRPAPPRRNVLARAFNAAYGRVEHAYAWAVGHLVRVPVVTLIVFAALLGLTGWWYLSRPTGFLPTEDQGYAIVNVQLPDGASLERTQATVAQINGLLADTPGVENWFVLGGFSLLDGANVPNAATVFVIFKPWDERTDPGQSQEAILGRLQREFYGVQEALVFAFVPPAIRGLGTTGGFQMQVEDREGEGLQALQQRAQEIIAAAQRHPEVGQATTTYRAAVPQLFVDIDRVKVKQQGLSLGAVFGTLQATLGSTFVNEFNKFGRSWQVRVQAQGRFRNRADDIRRLQVRNAAGQMVPLGSVARVEETLGPQIINRYNLYPTAAITGSAAAGASSGEALTAMERAAADVLPETMGFDWTGISYQERRVAGQEWGVFGLAVLLVYLVLAGQYESWLLPLAVILVVPLGLLGATAALAVAGIENNVYVQIGVVLIIALASKNAILIVEFARELRLHGRDRREAAVEASRLRFRPILMTSFAFILGVVPLVWATGAGAASRRSLGTAVFGGMIASTVLAVFVVPVFYVVVEWVIEKRYGPPQQLPPDAREPTPAPEGKAAEKERAADREPTADERTANPMPEARG